MRLAARPGPAAAAARAAESPARRPLLEPGRLTSVAALPPACSRHHPPRRSVSTRCGHTDAEGSRRERLIPLGCSRAEMRWRAERQLRQLQHGTAALQPAHSRAACDALSTECIASTAARTSFGGSLPVCMLRPPTPARRSRLPACLQRRGGGARVCGEPPRRAGRPGGRRCRPRRLLRAGEGSRECIRAAQPAGWRRTAVPALGIPRPAFWR